MIYLMFLLIFTNALWFVLMIKMESDHMKEIIDVTDKWCDFSQKLVNDIFDEIEKGDDCK